MKSVLLKIYFIFLPICSGSISNAQSVSINTTGTQAHESAILDISSTTKGLLLPRMTTVQRQIISSPASGLIVYDTDTKSAWLWKGLEWTELAGGGTPANFWSKYGADISNNNTGNVGINAAIPVNKLQIGSSPDFSGNDIAIGNVPFSISNSFSFIHKYQVRPNANRLWFWQSWYRHFESTG